jgi:uncharacterized protein YcgL (UPF0745 family)
MYSTLHQVASKPKVNFTINGNVICSHRLTRKEVDKVVKAMERRGYTLEVTSDGKTRES